MAELRKNKKMILSLSDKEIIMLLALQNGKKKTASTASGPTSRPASRHWIDEPISGLSKDGVSLLNELESQAKDLTASHRVDKKQLRYLRSLKKMKMKAPDFFRGDVDPKGMYHRLKSFCEDHDIPDEIVCRVVPALVSYIETGRMRPIIFVGEKGCGKTTAVNLLVKEALHIPTEVIKVPQTGGGHGMTGDCGIYQSADAGCIAMARLRYKNLLVAYIFDEIDKVTHDRSRANIDDELLSITDESCSDVFDNYLGTTLVGLEHCPMFFTANDLGKINPILADRCTIIPFPSASAARIKSISKKYADGKLSSGLYSMVDFDYGLMYKYVDRLVNHNVTSLRKHQQMIETVLGNALDAAFVQDGDTPVAVTEEMFSAAESAILGTVKRRLGFGP